MGKYGIMIGILVLWPSLEIGGSASADVVVYEDRLFPSDLVSQAAFPSRPYELSADETQLLFNSSHPDGNYLEVLLTLKIAGPGTLAGSLVGPAEVYIEIDSPIRSPVLPFTDDCDLLIGVTDGVSSVGFFRGDNGGGAGDFHEAAFLGSRLEDEAFVRLFDGSGTPDVFSATINIDAGTTTVHGAIGGMDGSHSGDRTISLNQDLWLIVVGQDQPEQYAIESIYVRVVPEPATLSLLSFCGLAVIRRRRK